MRAEIISVGTELLLGQIANTNAQYISRKLAEIGIDVLYHTAVGDNSSRVLDVLKIASQRSEIIIFTGGLGPTKDDLTKETIAGHLGKNLVMDKPSLERIEHYFIQRGITMTLNNQKQAHVIEGSQILPNDHGMAPGMAVESKGIHYLLLPGPPRELIPMFDVYAIPYFRSLSSEQAIVHSKVLRFFGIGESLLEDKLIDLIDGQSNPTIAPLANDGEVTIRITAKAKNVVEADEMIEKIETVIASRVGQFIYGYNSENLHTVAVNLLKKKQKTLALAESCTGGLISHLITAIAGCSEVFTGGVVSYSAESKIKALGIPSSLLDQHGTVSAETAKAMAVEVKQRLGADIGLSVTGVAGPEPVDHHPVGVVFIGLATAGRVEAYPLQLSGTREGIQLRAAKYGLFYIIQHLKNL